MSIQLPTKRKLNLEPGQPEIGQTLNIVARPQIQSKWCWASCIEMATDYKGNIIGQCLVANAAFNRLDCCVPNPKNPNNPVNPACNLTTTPSRMVLLCINYGYPRTRWIAGSLGIGQLITQIGGAHPVFAIIEWTTGGAHVVLVDGWGIDDSGTNWVGLNDPASGALIVRLTSLLAGFGYGSWTQSIVDM